jgi:ferredoxin
MPGILTKIMQSIMPLSSLDELEKALYDREGSIASMEAAPEQFRMAGSKSPPQQGSKLARVKRMIRMFPMMRKLGTDIVFSLKSVDMNPPAPKDVTSETFLREFEAHARSLGIGAIGYTELPREAVFRGKAVMFDHVIVVAMEMDKDKIDAAPSEETMQMIMDTYYRLGHSVNKLVDYLRDNGYAAQGGHPLGGQALYPLMAEKAGLGRHGRHGMIITPQFGPRQRLAAIYCGIKNLPVSHGNEHSWIADFCDQCGRCISACPVQAVYKTPIVREPGIITHIDAGSCFPYFNENHSCSVCVKECLFNKRPYKDLKKAFLR